MIDNPDSTCVDPVAAYGTFASALPGNAWDAVGLQPYNGATAGEEIQSAATMINLARTNEENADTSFYVYQVWPSASYSTGELAIDYAGKWLNTSTVPSADDGVRFERQWYDWYLDELSAEVPDASLNMIPVGEVMLALDQKFRDGLYSGIDDVSSLYRDNRHLNNVGRYTAHLTTWSVMHKTSPMTLDWQVGFGSVTPGTHGRDIPPNEELSDLVRTTIWEVLTSDPNAGVIDPTVVPGDYDGDNLVTIADYAAWRDALGHTGTDMAADGILNGIIDTADYDYWKQHFGASAASISQAPVPEPTAVALGALAAGFLAFAARTQLSPSAVISQRRN